MSQVSLSTMRARGRFKYMKDFVANAKALGFTRIEPNSTLTPEMLDELIAISIPISSIHCPCPAYLSSKGTPTASLSLSSTEESERREAIVFAKKTIELASRVGAKAIVIHMGEVPVNPAMEDELRSLYNQGLADSKEYSQTKEQLISERNSKAPRYLEAAKRSLNELCRYSQPLEVMLGLEVRDHLHEMPNINEMEELLSGAKEIVGYWHDVGHAEIQQRLGFTSHQEWLRHFQDRMIGIHLHDVLGLRDHCIPGRGDVDWDIIAKYLPKGAIRTCEIAEWNDEQYMPQAVPFLQKKEILG